MSLLITVVLFGIVFAYFATQNTSLVDVSVLNSVFTLPLYALALVSLLAGLLISAIISMIDGLSSSLALHQKDNSLKQKQQTVSEMSDKIRELELENARLKGRRDSIVDDSSTAGEKTKHFFRKLSNRV